MLSKTFYNGTLLVLFVAVLLNNAAHVLAGPLRARAPVRREISVKARDSTTVTTLDAATLAGFAPFTQFARAAYCQPDTTWTCGASCAANPTFQATLTGGDGDDVQFFYVGFLPDDNSVVVAHQGTDPAELMADLTDIDALHDTLNTTLFPGTDSSITVHKGFSDEHLKTAVPILAEVKRLIATKGATSVTLVGHSLGAALAELDSLFMSLNLPDNIAVKGVTYGTPRVGNQAYVTLFDSKVSDFTRINNELDLVPIVPGRFLGFSHVHGEVHIVSPGNAVSCPGDDDTTDTQCTDSSVPSIVDGSIANHLGPYEGISLGSAAC